jgi:taurine dioxygenase
MTALSQDASSIRDVVRRVTIAGDVPVSVDGRRSRSRGQYSKPANAIAAE